ncbi:MAG: pilus assembly protein [Alphaproteobacteria bacterium]|nr:pilus assembly protein [Alphaproteobacteria bacterium]
MKKFLRRFAKNDEGNATVEFVLWLPLIMGIIVGAFDLNIVLMTQSNMWTVARDTARRVAIGELDASTGQAYALSKLNYMNFEYGVDITVGDNVVVDIKTFLSNVAVLGTMGAMGNYAIDASVTMRSEQ